MVTSSSDTRSVLSASTQRLRPTLTILEYSAVDAGQVTGDATEHSYSKTLRSTPPAVLVTPETTAVWRAQPVPGQAARIAALTAAALSLSHSFALSGEVPPPLSCRQ